MSTPPIPQTTVSQSGMLSRSPGAKNLPSRPMMMPAMITPMMSTGDPFHLVGDGLVWRGASSRSGPPLTRMEKHRIAPHQVRGPTSDLGPAESGPHLTGGGLGVQELIEEG